MSKKLLFSYAVITIVFAAFFFAVYWNANYLIYVR